MENIGEIGKIIGQIFGVLALLLSCYKHFKKKRSDLVKISLFAYICYVIHYFLIGALAGSYTIAIAFFRDYYIYLREKHHKKHRNRVLYNNALIFVAFFAIYAAIIIMNFENPMNMLPPIAGVVYLFFEWFTTNKKTLKFAGGLTTLPWLVYDIVSFSIPATITDIMQIIASGLGIVKDLARKKKRR